MNLFKTNTFLLLILMLPSCLCALQSPDETLNREVKNLAAFSKIYGYVKYFHPSDEAQEIDWEKLAVLGVKMVKKAKTEEELKNILEELFQPIAPTIRFIETKPAGNSFISTYLEQVGGDTTGLKTVAWQHLGVDISNETRYASGRTNREDEASDAGYNHIYLHQKVLAQDLPGTTVRLRAMIKTAFKSQESEGELILRLDNAYSIPIQVVTETARPSISDSWTAYNVRADLDSSISQIKVGAILKKGGELWIADIQLEAKDQKDNWKPVPLQNAGEAYSQQYQSRKRSREFARAKTSSWRRRLKY